MVLPLQGTTGGTTIAYPHPSQKALLTEIRHRLRLVLGRNTRPPILDVLSLDIGEDQGYPFQGDSHSLISLVRHPIDLEILQKFVGLGAVPSEDCRGVCHGTLILLYFYLFSAYYIIRS